MTVKLIAVDMDGTFLDDTMQYDRARFAAAYRVMQERGIRFVVASGNQYFQLRSFFPDQDGIIYVAENGAYVTAESGTGDGVEYFVSSFEPAQVALTLALLGRAAEVHTVVCGKRSAYALGSEDPRFVAFMRRYYERLDMVDSFSDVHDDVLKFALVTPLAETAAIAEELRSGLAGIAVPVSSGHGSIDLIQPGVHKGSALARLGESLGIHPADMVAFGDGGNDIEMLQYVGCGVAMANAPDRVKAHADALTGSNNDDGVLAHIEGILS